MRFGIPAPLDEILAAPAHEPMVQEGIDKELVGLKGFGVDSGAVRPEIGNIKLLNNVAVLEGGEPVAAVTKVGLDTVRAGINVAEFVGAVRETASDTVTRRKDKRRRGALHGVGDRRTLNGLRVIVGSTPSENEAFVQ